MPWLDKLKNANKTFFAFIIFIFFLGLPQIADCQIVHFTRSNSGLVDNYVNHFSSFKGVPVVGTDNGISLIFPDRFESYRRGESQFPDAPVSALTTFQGNLWVGTVGKGISRLDEGRWKNFSQNDSGLIDDFVTALLVSNSRIFIGTKAGLCTFDGFLWETINFGLNEPVQVNFLAKGEGEIFVGTNQGVFRVENSLKPIPVLFDSEFLFSIQSLDFSNGTLFSGYDGGIIAIFSDGRKMKWKPDSFGFAKIFDIKAVEDGAIVATNRGIWRVFFDGRTIQIDLGVKGISSTPLKSLMHFGG
ncbi:hypothetical protein HYY75_06650, partial [bacterium]|nr:hypothetical protein [bacterium]